MSEPHENVNLQYFLQLSGYFCITFAFHQAKFFDFQWLEHFTDEVNRATKLKRSGPVGSNLRFWTAGPSSVSDRTLPDQNWAKLLTTLAEGGL